MAKAANKIFDVSTYNICADKDDLSFQTGILQSRDTKEARIRVNVESQEKFLDFRKAIEAAAKVRFTVEQSRPTKRFAWTRVFRCHHGTHKRRPDTKNPLKKTGQADLLHIRPIGYVMRFFVMLVQPRPCDYCAECNFMAQIIDRIVQLVFIK